MTLQRSLVALAALSFASTALALSCIDPCWDEWREVSASRVDSTTSVQGVDASLPEHIALRYNAYGDPMELEVDGVTLRFDWAPASTTSDDTGVY